MGKLRFLVDRLILSPTAITSFARWLFAVVLTAGLCVVLLGAAVLSPVEIEPGVWLALGLAPSLVVLGITIDIVGWSKEQLEDYVELGFDPSEGADDN